MLNLPKLLQDVFEPKAGENVIILNDFPKDEEDITEEYIRRKDMAIEWNKTFQTMAKIGKFTVEPIIYYFPTGGHGTPLPDEAEQDKKKINLLKKLKGFSKNDIVISITQYSATGPISELVHKQNFRFASMPMVDMAMTAFQADYKLVGRKARVLAKKLTEANAAIVTFDTGHEVYFDLRNRTAKIDDGVCTEPGQTINLPSGEAYIAPFDEPTSKTKGYIPVYYEKHLVIYEVFKNKIVDVITDSPKSNQMQKYFKEDPARGNIAELGLGCNNKATFINNVLQDEKIEGMHWAYGYNDYMGGSVGVTDFKDPLSAIHVDIIYTKEAKIKVRQILLQFEGKKRVVIMENSRYSFNMQKEFEKG